MRIKSPCRLFLVALPLHYRTCARHLPGFQYTAGNDTQAKVGSDPAQGSTTTVSTVLIPVTRSFDAAKKTVGRPSIMDATLSTSPESIA